MADVRIALAGPDEQPKEGLVGNTSRFPRRLTAMLSVCAVTFSLVTLGAFAPISSAYAGSAGARATSPACASSTLVIWIDTEGSVVSGNTYYDIELTNFSGKTCSILGYPVVVATNLTGHQLGSAASDNASHKPFAVTLAGGASAAAVLQITTAVGLRGLKCSPQLAAGLRVSAPNKGTGKVVPFPFQACSSTGHIFMKVQAVQKT
jgi:hypothetical protein